MICLEEFRKGWANVFPQQAPAVAGVTTAYGRKKELAFAMLCGMEAPPPTHHCASVHCDTGAMTGPCREGDKDGEKRIDSKGPRVSKLKISQ